VRIIKPSPSERKREAVNQKLFGGGIPKEPEAHRRIPTQAQVASIRRWCDAPSREFLIMMRG